jgi:hypothetical protein
MATTTQGTRVSVIANGRTSTVKALRVDRSLGWAGFLAQAGERLGVGRSVARVFLVDGAEVDSLELLNEGDVLVCTLSSEEAFAGVQMAATASSKQLSTAVAPTTTMMAQGSDWVSLNVGGTIFATTRSTLTRCKGSMLAVMFGNQEATQWRSHQDQSGNVLIDRNPDYFSPILNFLRCGTLIISKGVSPEGVLAEATFFGITELQ